MANLVNILSYTNTFGDLVAQQNKAAVELNTLAANNYTKNSGTLYLQGSGTGLSVTNTAILGASIVSGTTTAIGDVSAAANVTVTGLNYAFQVSNSAIIAKTTITDALIANTSVRTGILNSSGLSLVNELTSNTIIRTTTLNATGSAYVAGLIANTAVAVPYVNATTAGFFNNLTSNNSITTQNIFISLNTLANTITANTLTSNTLITAKDVTLTGNISSSGNITANNYLNPSLAGVATAPTATTNTSNTQIATTAFVKNALNSGNTFTMIATNVATTSNVQVNTLGVGTSPDTANTGSIRAINNITAYYSDERLKTRLGTIENALDKVDQLSGFFYKANEVAQSLGYTDKREVGLSAQEVQKVLPEVVVEAPIDSQYLTIHYERVIPLLVEAIKELRVEVEKLKK
jgi:hypothetical protein